MLPIHLALVSQTSSVGVAQIMQASAALQKQVTRDFGPLWGVTATVDAFAKLGDVPIGYWPILVRDDIGFPGAAGIHLDRNGQPYALVQASAEWVLTASHEVLEMLADPLGNRLVAGASPKTGQGRVEFLVEVCDPSEASGFGYDINGLRVSDFYTQNYFNPVTNPGTRYSFTGAITRPRQVLKGGYLSWRHPPTNTWFQQTFFTGSKAIIKSLGVLSGTGSLRSQIDGLTPTAVSIPPKQASKTRGYLAAAKRGGAGVNLTSAFSDACDARETQLEEDIALVKANCGI